MPEVVRSGAVRSVLAFARGITLGVGRGLATVFYMAALCGVVIGANAGYAADAPAEAVVEPVNDVDVQVTDTEPMVDVWYIPDRLEGGEAAHDAPNWYVDMVNTLATRAVNFALAVADLTASILYAHQWIPRIVIEGVVYAGILPLLVRPLIRARRML